MNSDSFSIRGTSYKACTSWWGGMRFYDTATEARSRTLYSLHSLVHEVLKTDTPLTSQDIASIEKMCNLRERHFRQATQASCLRAVRLWVVSWLAYIIWGGKTFASPKLENHLAAIQQPYISRLLADSTKIVEKVRSAKDARIVLTYEGAKYELRESCRKQKPFAVSVCRVWDRETGLASSGVILTIQEKGFSIYNDYLDHEQRHACDALANWLSEGEAPPAT